MGQHCNTHGIIGRKLRLGENRIQRCGYYPKHGIGSHATGKNNFAAGIDLQRILCCKVNCFGHAAKRICSGFCGNSVLFMELLNLILNTGQ